MDKSKKIVKQVSSGGFIFHQDKKSGEVWVILRKDINGEYWIPKGKLESDESELEASFREIEEEVGFNQTQIKFVGFCGKHDYGYDLDEKTTLKKELFVNIFETNDKHPTAPIDWNYTASVEWYLYHDALGKINFTKNLLEKSYKIFMKTK